MSYYHGSRNDSLKYLSIDNSKDKLVYVTDSRLVALTYAVRGYPNLFTTLTTGKEAFLELTPNLFKKMTKGKKVYIYTLEDSDYKMVAQNSRCSHSNCYSCNKDVKVIKKECIKDAYDEFLKYIDSNEFIIIKSEDIPNREEIIKDIIEKQYSSNINNKENFMKYIVS